MATIIGYGRLGFVGTNLLTLLRCGSCGFPIGKACLLPRCPHLDLVYLIVKQTNSAATAASGGMDLYKHIQDSHE